MMTKSKQSVSPDYRTLCAELPLCAELLSLLEESDDYLLREEDTVALASRAREALAQPEPEVVADGPAVPESREPASVVGEPSDEELLELHNWMTDEWAANHDFELPPSQFARAVLARYGHHPAPPAEGEVEELVAELRMMASHAAETCQFTDAESLSRAADLLERQAAPVPVPVNERLPGPEDCDAEGRCWWFCLECPGEHSYWILAKEVYCEPTYWLPAHALPLPSNTEISDSNE